MPDTPLHDLVVLADQALVDGRFGPAEVAVDDGVITAVAPGGTGLRGRETTRVDGGRVLLPGIVDAHVHVNEPGRTEWEGFDTATRAAAAGGVTTIIDMPLNSIPPTIDPEALRVKRAAAAPAAHVDIGFWGGAVPGNLGALRLLHDAGVFGFKAFLSPSGVDEFPPLDPAGLDAALDELAAFDGLLIVHAEDPAVLDAHANDGGPSAARFAESRPPEAELAAVRRVVDGIRRTGGRAHVLHVSSAAVLPLIAEAKAEGLRLTAETCPHYLTLDLAHIPDGATAFKCCPPIRDEANQDLLWAGLVDGTLDCVVSDHSPATAELKLGFHGDFGRAWGGISGLQLALANVWTEARRRGIGLELVVDRMARATADLVGLAAKGRIAVGADADLVAFAPDAGFTVDAAALRHRNPVSAYDGMARIGVAERVWLRGTPVDPDGPPAGRLLDRPTERSTR
ncbi:allantoinase AllB [Agromyces mangrovi Wang et al. 2018]|uniref:allantoinase AllB n=1 Tax=Agromyces mangrovi TaxID=1858653 RepID=UPI0025742BCB|nr:allantoinase AllB [Agromyces mangrovi]BDZ63681.1 allantoinase [Agromyces mangrovi]